MSFIETLNRKKVKQKCKVCDPKIVFISSFTVLGTKKRKKKEVFLAFNQNIYMHSESTNSTACKTIKWFDIGMHFACICKSIQIPRPQFKRTSNTKYGISFGCLYWLTTSPTHTYTFIIGKNTQKNTNLHFKLESQRKAPETVFKFKL